MQSIEVTCGFTDHTARHPEPQRPERTVRVCLTGLGGDCPAGTRLTLRMRSGRAGGPGGTYGGGEHGAAEPHGEALHVVCDHLHLHRSGLYSATAELSAESQSGIHHPFQVSLQPPPKVSEHCGASRKHDVLVERTTHIDGTVLYHLVNNIRDRLRKIRVRKL